MVSIESAKRTVDAFIAFSISVAISKNPILLDKNASTAISFAAFKIAGAVPFASSASKAKRNKEIFRTKALRMTIGCLQ